MRNRPRHKPNYRLEKLDGEILLTHPGTTKTIYLNHTAVLVWQLCTGQYTTTEIAQLLQDAFPDADASIADQVEETLQHLLDHQAIDLS
jgi:hypothetical protein